MSDAVQQIKDRLDILDVVSPYVELHKAGKNYKGKSPFSAEKTPSFYVSPDRGMYYCFSTSQGGDIFTFIQVMEGVDFKEALRILAQKAGVELVAEDPQKKTARERWYAALKEATDFYKSALTKEKDAVEYLDRRGVSKETIQKWQIGYAPGPPKSGWRELKGYLESKGYTKDELLKTGLIKTTEGGKEPFDVFRDRVMFPMADSSGKIVAFSGRILSKDSDAPKYVNSPETELYKKSELLFGYDKAKHGIRALDFSLIVEGQFDVVMSHQAGYANAVAVSGTALTPHHVHLLKRLSNRVVLALDADRAGIAAMKRAADLMLREGIDVKVAVLPEGKDPADLILEGKEKFKKIVGESVHVIEFLLLNLGQGLKDERSFKLQAREEILPFVVLLPSRIDQEHFIDIVAKHIKSTPDAVRYEVDRLRTERKHEVPQVVSDNSSTVVEQTTTDDSLLSLVTYLEASLFLLPKAKTDRVRSTMDVILGDHAMVVSKELIAEATFTTERQFEGLSTKAIDEEVISRLNLLKQLWPKKKIRELRQQLQDAERLGEEAAVEKIMKEIVKLQSELQKPAFDETYLSGKND